MAPAVKLLVTSREALGLQEEWFYPITGLSFPMTAPDNSAAAVEYDAVRFFVQCARRTQPGFALAADRAAVLHICQMVEGMPLAIELAAAWLKVLTPQQIVCELERGLDILTARYQNIPARHRSMRAVMEHSWNLLAAEERKIAARLSVFLGGFHAKAAAEIAGAPLPMLAILVEKALVRMTPDRRYQMHELVRQYMAAHLQADSQEEPATLDRHSAYYVRWLRQRGDWLRSDQQGTALAEFALEAENVRAAWSWAVARRHSEAIQSAAFDLIDFYDWLSWFQEAERLFAEAVQQLEGSTSTASAQAQTPPGLGYALLGFGAFSCRIGHYERAQEALQRTLAILRTKNDSPALSRTLYWLAMVGNHLGQYAEARRCAEEGLGLAEQDDERIMVARLLNLLGFVALFEGQYAQAEEQFARALATARQLGNQKLTILLLTNLSWSLRLQQKYEQSRQLLHESIALAEGIGERRLLAFAQGSMGQLAFELGEYTDAQRWFRESLPIMQAIHESWGTTGTLNHLGQTALALGEIAEARRLFHELLEVADEDGLPPRQLDALVGFAQLEAFDGHHQQALELLTYVIQHSAVQRETKDRAERLRSDLTAKMTTEQVAQVEVSDLVQPIAALVARYTEGRGVALPANLIFAR
jgi:predicted ATPase